MSASVPPLNPMSLSPRPSGPTTPIVGERTRHHRPGSARWMFWMTLGILLLTAMLVYLEFGRKDGDAVRIKSPAVSTTIVDASLLAKDVRVIVRPANGHPAMGFLVRPLGQAAKPTDIFGESRFDASSRGGSADVFDPRGKFIATVTIPLSGHLIVEILQ